MTIDGKIFWKIMPTDTVLCMAVCTCHTKHSIKLIGERIDPNGLGFSAEFLTTNMLIAHIICFQYVVS